MLSRFILGLAAALLLAGCTGGNGEAEDDEDGATPPARDTSEAGPTVSPPSDLTAKTNAFSIALTWTAPGGAPVDHYAVYRDGSFVRSVAAPNVSFVDGDVVPGKRYTYELEARLDGAPSDRVTVEATTPKPPLRAARVQGTFDVRTKKLSSKGYRNLRAGAFGWQFRPRCGKGACDVRWNDAQRRRVRALVNRQGPRYAGEYRGFYYVTCRGKRSTTTVSIRFKVDAARAIGAAWRATRLRGTMTQSEAAQLGCVASRARFEIRARLIT